MNSISKERELQSCDTVKTIAMLAVVICHCAAACARQGWFVVSPVKNTIALGYLSSFLGMYHIQTFVFVSGYLFYFLKYELGKYKNSLEFIKKKALRLLAPYPVACLWVLPAFLFFYHPSSDRVFKKFALGEGPSQLWFLFMLFWVFVEFYFISKILDRYNFFQKMTLKTTVIVGVFFYLVDFCSPLLDRLGVPNVFQILAAFRYIFYFYAGFVFRKFDFSKLYKFAEIFLALSAVITLLFISFVHGKLEFIFMNFVSLFNCVSVFMFVAKHLNPKSKIFEIINKYNFQIYLFHQQIIYVIIFLLDRYWAVYSYPAFAISIVGSLAISVGITFVLSKIKPARVILGIKQ